MSVSIHRLYSSLDHTSYCIKYSAKFAVDSVRYSTHTSEIDYDTVQYSMIQCMNLAIAGHRFCQFRPKKQGRTISPQSAVHRIDSIDNIKCATSSYSS